MAVVARAWEVTKTHDTNQSLLSYQYEGLSCMIIHDHTTKGRQRTLLFFSGRTTMERLMVKATSFAQDVGYNIESDVPLHNNKPPIPVKERFWASGKPRVAKTFRAPQVMASEEDVPETTEEEEATGGNPNHRLFFPEAGNGVVISATPGRKNWIVNVWSYGDECLEVINKAANYARIISESEDGVAVTKSRPSRLAFGAATVFCLGWLLGWFGVVQPGIANVSLFAALFSSCVGLWGWWRSPVRKNLPFRYMPKSVLKAARPPSRSGYVGKRKNSFEMPSDADLAFCMNVPINASVLPDLGGVSVGSDGTGQVVRIPDADRYMGITVVGSPGSGKTTMMLRLAGGDMMRMKAGEQHTLVWFETKRDGAQRLMDIAEKADIEPLVFVPGSSQGPQLRWLEWDDARADAGTLTEAFVHAFEPSSILEQSRDILVGLINMASMVWWEHLESIGETDRMNLMRTAWILGGGRSWEIAESLMEQVKKDNPNIERFRKCRESLTNYVDIAPNRRADKMSAPLNKLNRLKDCPAWDIDLRREAMTWRDVLESKRPVIVDVSQFDDSTLAEPGYSEELIRILLPTALYTLWSQAQFHCNDWYSSGRSVSLYCDEASNLPWQSGHILTTMSDQGRSRGISLVLGAQRWDNLSDITQGAFKAAGHKFFLSQQDESSAADLASSFEGSAYSKESLTKIKPFQALATIRIGAALRSPTFLHIANDRDWEPGGSWTRTLEDERVSCGDLPGGEDR